MTRARILLIAAVLAMAATVWFAVAFARAGRVPAGPGGRDRVVVPVARRADRTAAATRYVGALVVIGVGAVVARRATARRV
jgi:hypothetical protein